MTDQTLPEGCPACGALPCDQVDDPRAKRSMTKWREAYANYMRSCGPMDQVEADRLAWVAWEADGSEDPEETASSDLACMREDAA